MKFISFLSLILLLPIFVTAISPSLSADLVKKALEGQKKAYAPYSQYYVGAAILTKSGKIYTGCNIENASYGLCNCAERTALFKAVSEGEKEFEAIAVVTRDGGMPCGACRQVLNEFNPDLHIITLDESGTIRNELSLGQLLPQAFGPSNLQ